MQTQVFVQLGTILLWLGDLGPHLECSQGGKEGELSVLPELVQKTKPCRRGCKPLQVYSHLYVSLKVFGQAIHKTTSYLCRPSRTIFNCLQD